MTPLSNHHGPTNHDGEETAAIIKNTRMAPFRMAMMSVALAVVTTATLWIVFASSHDGKITDTPGVVIKCGLRLPTGARYCSNDNVTVLLQKNLPNITYVDDDAWIEWPNYKCIKRGGFADVEGELSPRRSYLDGLYDFYADEDGEVVEPMQFCEEAIYVYDRYNKWQTP